MLRIGASPADMREMNSDDIFISRLKLLIVMSSAYLKQYPLGNFRKEAVIRNANSVAGGIDDWQERISNSQGNHEQRNDFTFDHVFFQRVKLLAVMAKALAEDHPMGYHRQKSMEDNLNFVCEALRFNRLLMEKSFFKVA
jgi:hypothetical protein